MNPDDKLPSNVENPTPVQHTQDMDNALPPGADAEERFNNFWSENGTSIFISLIIAAIVVIGMQVWRYSKQRAEVNTEAAFASAISSEQLISFTQNHAKHPLAGAAYMKMADGEFTAGQFKQATEHYLLAKDRLAGTPFQERAALGAAVCEYLGGNVQTGIADMRTILDNPDNLETTRAEAAFNLALLYIQKQDFKSLKEIVDIADTLSANDSYAVMTRSFRAQIPEQK
jgi:hypothetical protein